MKPWFLYVFISLFICCRPVAINQPFKMNDIILDSTIIGTWEAEWVGEPSESPKKIKVSQIDSIRYLIVYDTFTKYSITLTKMKNDLVGSITYFPNFREDEKNGADILHIPGYFFVKVKVVNKDTISVGLFDSDSLVNAGKKKGLNIATCNGFSLLTSPTERLRDLLSESLHKKLFIKAVLLLKRNEI